LYDFSPQQSGKKQAFLISLYDAYYCSKICIYAQGMDIIQQKSNEQNWDIDIRECVRVWKNGCIIRGNILDTIQKEGKVPLLASPFFKEQIQFRQRNWRDVASLYLSQHIPAPVLNGSLTYFDAMTTNTLPSNLVQAQRDYFGNHGYQRIDREGIFFSNW